MEDVVSSVRKGGRNDAIRSPIPDMVKKPPINAVLSKRKMASASAILLNVSVEGKPNTSVTNSGPNIIIIMANRVQKRMPFSFEQMSLKTPSVGGKIKKPMTKLTTALKPFPVNASNNRSFRNTHLLFINNLIGHDSSISFHPSDPI